MQNIIKDYRLNSDKIKSGDINYSKIYNINTLCISCIRILKHKPFLKYNRYNSIAVNNKFDGVLRHKNICHKNF